MTFSIIQHETGAQRIIGTLWVNDESGAQQLAPIFFPSAEELNLSIERTDDREIPLRVSAAAQQIAA